MINLVRKNEPMKKFRSSLVNRIDELRLTKGISWEKLAYSSGVAKSTLSEIKRGITEPKLSNLYKLAMALDTTVVEMLSSGIDLSEFDV